MTSGSKFGWSYLSGWSDCPTKGYLRNLAPWPGSGIRIDPATRKLTLDQDIVGDNPEGGLPIGIEPKRHSPALDIGSWVHKGMEGFYLSGIKGGQDTRQRSIEFALDEINKCLPENPTDQDTDNLAVALRLMRQYGAHYGLDHEVEVVFHPDGSPMVEGELWLDLGYEGYQFTSRLDLIYRRNGYLYALEHKTTAASALSKLISRFTIDGQVTGQFLQLASHFPDEPIGAVTLNALVKDRGAKSDLPSFIRRDYARTHAQLEKFRLDMVRKLKTIDRLIEEWTDLVAKGMDFNDAAQVVFDGSPSGTQCVGMGYSCEFLQLCQSREVLGRLLLDNYQPRTYENSWSNPLRPPTAGPKIAE